MNSDNSVWKRNQNKNDSYVFFRLKSERSFFEMAWYVFDVISVLLFGRIKRISNGNFKWDVETIELVNASRQSLWKIAEKRCSSVRTSLWYVSHVISFLFMFLVTDESSFKLICNFSFCFNFFYRKTNWSVYRWSQETESKRFEEDSERLGRTMWRLSWENRLHS